MFGDRTLQVMRFSCGLLGVLLAVVSVGIGAAEYNPVRKQPAAASVSTGRVIVNLSAAASERAKAQTANGTIPALAGRNQLTLKQTRQITSRLHVMQFEPQTSGESLDESLVRRAATSFSVFKASRYRAEPFGTALRP